MSRRDHASDRCPGCRMRSVLCVCALLPRLVTRSRLLLLVHRSEARKPTNTGQLAARCLAGSRVEVVGDAAHPLPLPLVAPGERAVLLYPHEDALPIASLAHGSPVTLVVPDGNWRQAAKMGRRVPGLDAIPRVKLADPRPTEYHLRSEPQPEGLATIEAIARALRVLEGDAGPGIEAALLEVLRVMVARTLWSRGTIASGDVVGGVPIGGRSILSR